MSDGVLAFVNGGLVACWCVLSAAGGWQELQAELQAHQQVCSAHAMLAGEMALTVAWAQELEAELQKLGDQLAPLLVQFKVSACVVCMCYVVAGLYASLPLALKLALGDTD